MTLGGLPSRHYGAMFALAGCDKSLSGMMMAMIRPCPAPTR